MGIDTSWKQVLSTWWEMAWLVTVPSNQKITVLIDDLPVNVRKFTMGAKHGTTIRKKFKDRLSRLQDNCDGLNYYIATIDEPAYVPTAKQSTQRKRSESEQPFTKEELQKYSFRITDGMLPDMKRFMATRSLQPELYRYLTEILMSNPMSEKKKPVRIDIDGGIIWKEKNGVMATEPAYVIIQPCVAPQTYDASRFGEADVKIAKHIARNGKDDVFYVCSYDTDLIPILLLAARDWIDPDGNVNRRVYLDTDHMGHALYLRGLDEGYQQPNTTPAAKETSNGKKKGKEEEGSRKRKRADEAPKERKPLVDVVFLWRCIQRYFNAYYPDIKDPIEVMVLMMIMTGTDFVESLPGIGAKTMMDAFDVIGHKLMYAGGPILTKDESDPNELNVECPWDTQHNIVLAEHKVYQWVVAVYYYAICEKGPDTLDIFSFEKVKGTEGRCRLDMTMDSLRKVGCRGMEIPSDYQLMAYARRVAWNMDYWSNGWKTCGYNVPTEVHPESGYSLYGWVAEDEFVDGTKRQKVTAAKFIHR